MTNRIVVDCFYFTQAITLCLLVYFNSNLQCLRASPSTPADYHRVQRFIVYECCCTDPKTLCKFPCYVSIIVSIILLVTTFWLNRIHFLRLLLYQLSYIWLLFRLDQTVGLEPTTQSLECKNCC